MNRVRLIQWNAEEAAERAIRLQAPDLEVAHEMVDPPGLLRELRQDPPSAVVIDLSRLPMQGRDVGVALRSSKSTRAVPLLFVAGDPKKVERVQQCLPDAIYTTWDQMEAALREAIANPPEVQVIPRSRLAGYSGTPLVKKLGIGPNAIVALIDAPPGFEDLLVDLPAGVKLRRQTKGQRNLTIWFTRSCQDLEEGIVIMALLAEQGPLWIAWPKKGSPLASDVTEAEVRKLGLTTGLVDYKVCAIDATWSGLLFTRRQAR